jgi:hypothetical protein
MSRGDRTRARLSEASLRIPVCPPKGAGLRYGSHALAQLAVRALV